MNQVSIEPIDVSSANAALETAEKLKTLSQNIVIKNDGDYESAGVNLKEIKSQIKTLDDERKKLTKPIDEAKKNIMALFKKPLDVLTAAETAYKKSMVTYVVEQDRKKREEEAKLEREAEKRRIELEKQAKKHEEKGNIEKAQERAELADAVMPAVSGIQTPKAAGVFMREIWKYRIVDDKIIPREFLIVNEKLLGEMARSTKGVVPVAGVEFYSEKVLAA